MVTTDQVWDALARVNDPEYPLSVVDLGMVYGVGVNHKDIQIEMTFTAIGCPAIDMIIADVRDEVGKIPEVQGVNVDVVWSPAWTKACITDKGRQILQYYGVGL